MKFIFAIFLIVASFYLGYQFIWPLLISAYDWLIELTKLTVSVLFYGFWIVIFLIFVFMVLNHKENILKYISATKRTLILHFNNRKFKQFKKINGNEVGRCATVEVKDPRVLNGNPVILILQRVLSISGKFRGYLDIQKRLDSFEIQTRSIKLNELSAGLLSFGIKSEHIHSTYQNISLWIWRALNNGQIVILPVNHYRLMHPEDSLLAGGSFSDVIVVTGMKVSYSGNLILCFIAHTSKDSNVQMVEEVYIPSFASKQFLCVSI